MKKILSLDELSKIITQERLNNKTFAVCHGCFDLVHPGHIKHLQEAARQADYLIVTVTPDRYVKKGPNRPFFPEELRLEQLAALEMVNFTALNKWPTSIETLHLLKPDVYVKGPDYEDRSKDITGNIQREIDVVESYNGRIHITQDIIFSSTKLINKGFRTLPDKARNYVDTLKKSYSTEDIEALIDRLSNLKVLVFGDTIIDEYAFCKPMGRVEKAPIISMKYQYEERFAGGILAVANHAAQFAGEVKLVTTTGGNDNLEKFAKENLDPRVKAQFFKRDDLHTIVKRRFLSVDGKSKVFEVGWIDDELISGKVEDDILAALESTSKSVDMIIVGDFGHGTVSQNVIDFLETSSRVFALNAQTNSTNFGYNYITRYRKPDFISIDENEIRLPFQSKTQDIEILVAKLAETVSCANLMITLGSKGALYYHDGSIERCPALASSIVDTVGAGDAFFTIASLLWKSGCDPSLIPFIGNVVGALAVGIIGNKEPVRKSDLVTFIRGMMA